MTMNTLTRLLPLLMLVSCGRVEPEFAPRPDDVGARTQALNGATELWTESSLSTGDLANVSSCIVAGRLWAHNSAEWNGNRARIFERTVTLEANQSILIEGHLNLVSAAHAAIGVTARLVVNGPHGEDFATFFGENHMGKLKGTMEVCNDLSDEPNSTLELHGAKVYMAPSAGTYTITLAAVAYQSNAPEWTGACPNGQAKTVPCKHGSSCTLTNENAYLAVATGSATSFLRVNTLNAVPTQWLATGSEIYAPGSLNTFTHGTYTVPPSVTEAAFYSQLAIDCNSANCTTESGTADVRTRLCVGDTSYCTAWNPSSGYYELNQNKHHKMFNNRVDWTNKLLAPLTRAVTPGEQLSVFSQIEVALTGEPAQANPSANGYYAFAYPTSICTPETDPIFCGRYGKDCGSYTNTDNCGISRTANCGTCTSPQTCGGGHTSNVCACPEETDAAFCGRYGKNCGWYTNTDNCGTSRTANCGTCTSPQICGSTPPSVCCTPETDAAFCGRYGVTCGWYTNTDNCGNSRTVLCGGGSATGYIDGDGDGYGAGAYGCYTGNVAQNNADCCDGDSRAYPGTAVGYSSPNACGSWDYNCNGNITVTNPSKHYAYNTGGLAASYSSNGSTCTRGNYSGFYRTPGVYVTSASCGTNVKVQPCSWYYYSSTSCTTLIGYQHCTNRLVECN
ncbi:hypothetical protein JRI60_07990 [Archangium violaceum]|uniref:hypothetical protein n=1 Tax=Archangium violaceum TaxID=83451 RepID=UPI001950D637|nr:hypothetical protein [Archangium violaceum]QRN98958.1 hypothetical protein JRI60_07990 [Archangium violaceum]